MSGIAGMLDLSGRRPVPVDVLERMARAMVHRGPDEEGILERPGLGLVSRRLNVIASKNHRQPIYNEDGSIAVVFHGELIDYREVRSRLEGRGHHFYTNDHTELIAHLWEDHQEGLFEHLRGQFALALWDENRQRLILARDRFGICPLSWTRQSAPEGEWLLFASEIKVLLASGLVKAAPDVRGIDQVFNFFAVPGPHTCFQGVELLQPGQFLRFQRQPAGTVHVERRVYWEIDFPDRGQEERGDIKGLVDRFEALLLRAIEKRLRDDVPIVSYLSGGIDSSTVAALAAKIRGRPLPTFTIQIKDRQLDETAQAAIVLRHLGARSVVVPCGDEEVTGTFPQLTWAAEAPVVDTSCTAMLLLAKAVHQHGYKVAITGEGSDEWLAGYSWYKIHRLMSFLDLIPGLPLSMLLRRGIMKIIGAPQGSAAYVARVRRAIGDHTPFQDV